jgi:hypothetical protein
MGSMAIPSQAVYVILTYVHQRIHAKLLKYAFKVVAKKDAKELLAELVPNAIRIPIDAFVCHSSLVIRICFAYHVSILIH